ncbi:Uncharacterised protein [Chlamydia trachomatis]|nr:Uncharacterised protein [Chlamydia trachomatis]CRH94456.1 Uncharacterised protein [Chlamydia trachomatis]
MSKYEHRSLPEQITFLEIATLSDCATVLSVQQHGLSYDNPHVHRAISNLVKLLQTLAWMKSVLPVMAVMPVLKFC